MSKKRKGPQFDAAAAYNAAPDDETMGQGAAPGGAATATTDASQGAGSGQPLSFPPEQVAQMEQLKQQNDMQGLGTYVAQFLP